MICGIFGAGRNGTTLLMRLLDGSPDLWVHPVELSVLSVFNDLSLFRRVRTRTAQNATTRKLRRADREVETKLLLKEYSSQVSELNDVYVANLAVPMMVKGDPLKGIEGRDVYSAREFLPLFLDRFRASYDDRVSVAPRVNMFKTLETPYVAEYARIFPDMRFLHIVRHPVSNFGSLKRSLMANKALPFWYIGNDALRTFIEKRWLPHARTIVRARAAGDPRHRIVRYEDLVHNPAHVIRGICDWLGIAPPPEPTFQTVLGGKKMVELPKNPSKRGLATPPEVKADMAKEFVYEEVVTPREQAFIYFRTQRFARQLGYFDPEGSAVPAVSRLELCRRWLLPDEWEVRHARSKLRLGCALLGRRGYILGRLLRPGALDR